MNLLQKQINLTMLLIGLCQNVIMAQNIDETDYHAGRETRLQCNNNNTLRCTGLPLKRDVCDFMFASLRSRVM